MLFTTKSWRMGASLNLISAGKLLFFLVVVRILLILYFSGPLMKKPDPDFDVINKGNNDLILARLSRATSELDNLRSQNQELKNLLQSYLPSDQPVNSKHSSTHDDSRNDLLVNLKSYASLPDKEYELTRRRLGFNLNELWFFLHSLRLNSSIYNYIYQHRASYLYDLGEWVSI